MSHILSAIEEIYPQVLERFACDDQKYLSVSSVHLRRFCGQIEVVVRPGKEEPKFVPLPNVVGDLPLWQQASIYAACCRILSWGDEGFAAAHFRDPKVSAESVMTFTRDGYQALLERKRTVTGSVHKRRLNARIAQVAAAFAANPGVDVVEVDFANPAVSSKVAAEAK